MLPPMWPLRLPGRETMFSWPLLLSLPQRRGVVSSHACTTLTPIHCPETCDVMLPEREITSQPPSGQIRPSEGTQNGHQGATMGGWRKVLRPLPTPRSPNQCIPTPGRQSKLGERITWKGMRYKLYKIITNCTYYFIKCQENCVSKQHTKKYINVLLFAFFKQQYDYPRKYKG